MVNLHATLLKYQLVERLYPATVAGLEYTCYSADKGLVLKVNFYSLNFKVNSTHFWCVFLAQVSGYNQKLHVIIDAFTKCLKSLADDVTEEQYRVFVQQLFKTYENIFRKPKAIGKELRLSVVQKHHVPLTEKNRRLKKIDFNDFQKFCRQYCDQVKIKAIMQGNLLEERAHSMMQIVLSNLNCGKILDVSINWIKLSISLNRANKYFPTADIGSTPCDQDPAWLQLSSRAIVQPERREFGDHQFLSNWPNYVPHQCTDRPVDDDRRRAALRYSSQQRTTGL